jgi:hypothetical protein
VFIKGILKSNLVNQEYGPSLKLSVIKDLDPSHPTGKVFVNLERGLRLKTIVTGKL